MIFIVTLITHKNDKYNVQPLYRAYCVRVCVCVCGFGSVRKKLLCTYRECLSAMTA